MKKTLLQKGFSLIELLVVIAIIAILTAIVTSNFASSKAKSRDANRVSDLAQIQLALSLYFDKCNVYPTTGITENSYGTGCSAKFGDFISRVPKDPSSPFPQYAYRTNASAANGQKATNYVLAALLEVNNPTILSDSLTTIPADMVSPSFGSGTAMTSTYCTGLRYCVTSN